jgi:hypothetical protein
MIFSGIGEQNDTPSESHLLRSTMALDQGVKVGSFWVG